MKSRWVVSCCSLVAGTVVIVACGGANGTPAGTATPTATQAPAPTPEATYYEIPPQDGPRFKPAQSDEFGTWQSVEMHGVTVEIPTGDNWHVQFARHPCFGAGRYYILLEERSTGDRLRIDPLAATTVLSASPDPAIFALLRERIQRSLAGAYEEPFVVKTFGPQPTSVTCADEDPDVVPTLAVDDFTPPPSTPFPPELRP